MYFVTVYANGIIVEKAGMQKRKRRPEKGGFRRSRPAQKKVRPRAHLLFWLLPAHHTPGFQLDSALRA